MMQLWTPTDWAAETELRKEYINWLVQYNGLPCLRITNIYLGAVPITDPEALLKIFSEQGFLFFNSDEPELSFSVLTFEEWRATRGESVMSATFTNKQLQDTPTFKHFNNRI